MWVVPWIPHAIVPMLECSYSELMHFINPRPQRTIMPTCQPVQKLAECLSFNQRSHNYIRWHTQLTWSTYILSWEWFQWILVVWKYKLWERKARTIGKWFLSHCCLGFQSKKYSNSLAWVKTVSKYHVQIHSQPSWTTYWLTPKNLYK